MQNQHGGDVYRYPGVIDFSANVNPLPIPAPILEAIQESLSLLSQYPDQNCGRLRKALSAKLSCPVEDIICGNGAADLLFTLVLASNPRKALLTSPGFSEYEAALKSVGAEIVHYPLKEREGFVLTEEYLSVLTEDLDMAFLCSPHNPTGSLIDRNLLLEVAAVCEEKKILLVMDECFQDFLPEPALCSLLPAFACGRGISVWTGAAAGQMAQGTSGWKDSAAIGQYVFVLKSFTKMFGLAGLRLGYGVTKNQKLLQQMIQCRQAWPVSIPAENAGIAALEQEEYVRMSRKYIQKERQYLCHGLRDCGWQVYEPSANFIFFHGEDGLQKKMLEQGILIRDCSNYRGLGQGYYRIAVKRHEDNETLLNAIKVCKE